MREIIHKMIGEKMKKNKNEIYLQLVKSIKSSVKSEDRKDYLDILKKMIIKDIKKEDVPKEINNPETMSKFLTGLGMPNPTIINIIGKMTNNTTPNSDLEKAYDRYNIIYLEGPSGVGKTSVAKEIHEKMNPGTPFKKITAGTGSPTLIESELFGHKKGAFTGAVADRESPFVAAKNGTIFIDEIENLPLELQPKLLDVLSDKEIVPVGGNDPIPIDCKIIIASNQDLDELAAEGKFREDLLSRIKSGYVKKLGKTTERPDDVIDAIDNIIEKLSEKEGVDVQCSDEAINMLQRIELKGNFRDLESILTNAFYNTVDAGDDVITPEHIKNDAVNIEKIIDELKQSEYADYDPDTLKYLANKIIKQGKDSIEKSQIKSDRIEQVYRKLGGKENIRKWINTHADVIGSILNGTNLSDKRITDAFVQLVNREGYYDDLLQGINNMISEDKDDPFLSHLPHEKEIEEMDVRVLEAMDNTILMADEDIIGIANNL